MADALSDPLSNDLEIRGRDFVDLMRCACEFTGRCNPESQKVARLLKIAPVDCLLYSGHQTHTNPTSREDIRTPF